jgi:hypothetical protein
MSIYFISVVFLTIPITLNTVLAFIIITRENENPELKFYKWFMQHIKVASVFTVLAGADIDALTILQRFYINKELSHTISCLYLH